MNWKEQQRWSEYRSRMRRVLWPESKGTFKAERNKKKAMALELDRKARAQGMRSKMRLTILADRRLRQRNHEGIQQP